MARLGLLHGIHREGPDGVDAGPDELVLQVDFTVGGRRAIRPRYSCPGAFDVQEGPLGKWNGKIMKGVGEAERRRGGVMLWNEDKTGK